MAYYKLYAEISAMQDIDRRYLYLDHSTRLVYNMWPTETGFAHKAAHPMLMTDHEIREACERGDISIDPFDEGQLHGATYDLRVGDQGATTSGKKKVDIRKDGYLSLAAGDLGVVVVWEHLKLGQQYAARFSLRSKYARKGLLATTGHIDPGFNGRLRIGVTNLTPRAMSLPHKDDLVSVEFHRLQSPAEKDFSGPFQDKMEITAEDIEFITESEGMAFSEVITTLRSVSKNVESLTSELRAIKWSTPLVVAVGILVISVLVTLD